MNWWNNLKTKFNVRIWLMITLLLLGIISISLGIIIDDSHAFLKPFFEKLGDAISIAAFLGLTIEWWMIKEIAGDVFKASLGHILPAELKNELRWIYTQKCLSENHIHKVKLEIIPNTNLVAVTTNMVKYVKNVSGEKFTLPPPTVAVDEWGVEGHKSEIYKFGYQYKEDAPVENFSYTKNPPPDYIKAELPSITLYPNDRLKTWFTLKEIKQLNDSVMCVFSYPVHKPILIIDGPDELDWIGGFGHRENCERDIGTGVWKLPETLLPNQFLKVRWWPKKRP